LTPGQSPGPRPTRSTRSSKTTWSSQTSRTPWIPAVVLGLLLVLIVSCAINPVTGKRELMLIPESLEIEMGKETDVSIRQEYGIYEDEALNAYIRSVGEKMVPITHRPALPYHFAVLDTPIENAFAAPGGYIYITRGMLALMNDEAGLAAILGHELGHVNARHTARAMSRQLLMMGGVILASALSEDIQKIAPFALIGLQVLFLKYSRDDEYQADTLGVQYSRAVGYAPGQVVPLFRSFLRMEKASGGPKIPNFLSTHPLTAKRIDEIQQMLRPEDEILAVRKPEYLARLNGLVVGENPRQGFLEGNAFYHPDLKFRVSIPAGWKLQNTPKQLLLAPDNEEAALFLTAETSNADLSSYMNTKLTQFSESQVNELTRNQVQVNGLLGYRGVYTVRSKTSTDAGAGQDESAKPMTVEIDCIKKGGQIFTFLGAAETSQFGKYENAIAQTVRSFGPVNDPNVLNRRPRTLNVVTAAAGGSLRSFLQAQGVPQKQWDAHALMNGLALDDQMERGRRVKVVR
jgi:predicted Zn-dependent protease